MRKNLHEFVSRRHLETLFQLAFEEDFGERGDISSQALLAQFGDISAHFVSRESGVVAGLAAIDMLLEVFGRKLAFQQVKADGDRVKPKDVIATVDGPYGDVLAFERTALNLLTHLSGIATLTSRYVELVQEVAGNRVAVCDTRKTHLGHRGLEKYAVMCGGGVSHRMGLYDAIMWKDNHIAQIPADQLGVVIAEKVKESREKYGSLAFIEIEVDSLSQLDKILDTGVSIVLLDNMRPELLGEAVRMRNERVGPEAVQLEASGGIGLDTIAEVARSGVDRISVGALTHSAKAFDIGLDFSIS